MLNDTLHLKKTLTARYGMLCSAFFFPVERKTRDNKQITMHIGIVYNETLT